MAFSTASPADSLPDGIHALPGPSLLVATRYTSSPVGPYLEVAVLVPARIGPRPGMHVYTMVVDSSASQEGGRRNWGFPKEMGTLGWDTTGGRVSLRWEEGGLEIEGRPRGPAVPLAVPIHCLQRRGDGPVRVPGWLRGRARGSRVAVHAPAGDSLEALAGQRRGLVVTNLQLTMAPARAVNAAADTADGAAAGA